MKKLNNPVTVTGLVVHGSQLGRTISYPTANIVTKQPFNPKPGVYLAICSIGRQSYLGLAYYGLQHLDPEAVSNRFEVYLLDFDKNIYAQTIKVKLTHYLRPPKEVKNLLVLKKLINKDLSKFDNYTVLVNQNNQIRGIEKILIAHQNPPRRHRAISVLIFNSKKELLLQQRSQQKPLWPLFWSNTCCSNKRPGRSMLEFAAERLTFEMGLKTKLKFLYKFSYQAKYNQKLSESEIDYVYLGSTDQKPKLNSKEAAAYQYLSIVALKKDLAKNPQKYTPWLELIMKRLESSDILSS